MTALPRVARAVLSSHCPMRRVTTTRHPSPHWRALLVGTALGALLCLDVAPAEARVPTGSLPELVVDGRAEVFPLAIYKESVVFLYFSEPVLSVKRDNRNFEYNHLKGDRVVIVTPAKRRLRGSEHPTGTIACKTAEFTAHLKLSLATETDWTEPAYAVTHRTERQAREALIEAEVQRRTTIIEDTAQDDFDSESERRFVERLARSQQIFPAPEMSRHSGENLAMEFSSASWTGKQLYLVLDVSNDTTQPVPLDHLLTYDSDDQLHESHIRAMFPAIEPLDGVRYLPPARQTRVVLQIPDAIVGDFAATRVALTNASGKELAWVAVDAWQGNPLFRPKTKAQIEREAEELRLSKLDREARGRIMLQVQPMYGAMWLANPQTDGPLGSASLAGMSVRIGYGFNRFWSVEGEISGASSGDVRFSRMVYQNLPGDMIRSASVGRAQFGGLLRIGEQFTPTLRLGIGLQGSSHGVRFSPDDGATMQGPGAGFQVDGYFALGAGFDVRLGERWLIGLQGGYTQAIGDPLRSVHAGLHLSYSWQPGGITGR